MAVSDDILATWRGPGRVMARLMAQRPSEGRVLAWLMAGCALTFVAQWPVLARRAHLQEAELGPMMGGSLLAWLFIAPLVFYGIAALSGLGLRLVAGPVKGQGPRIALFWAFLAASPLMLLNGLVAGFIGPGPGLVLVGLVWVGAFLWFWIAGLRAAARGRGGAAEA